MRDVYFRGAFSEIFLYYKSFCLFVFIVKEGPAGMLHRQTAKSLDYIASHTDSSRMIDPRRQSNCLLLTLTTP